MLTLRLRALRAAAFALLVATLAIPSHHALAADAPTMKKPDKLMYWRLYTSADGNSHWSEEQLPLAQSGAAGPEGRRDGWCRATTG